jgi:putative flippase GtrA
VAIFFGLIDYIGFIILFTLTGDILISESIARSLSGVLYFGAIRNLVFKSKSSISLSIIGYIALTVVNIIFSYSLISFLIYLGIDVYISKAFVLIMMSIINFSVQNSIIFRNKSQ